MRLTLTDHGIVPAPYELLAEVRLEQASLASIEGRTLYLAERIRGPSRYLLAVLQTIARGDFKVSRAARIHRIRTSSL
jgi:hypothetical protein